VKRLRYLLLVSALGLVLSICGWWAYRELSLEHGQGSYSREFVPGMKRQVIEDRLLSEGIRFFPESPSVDFVSVGFEAFPHSVICAPREVGLVLQFELRNGAPSGADVLRTVMPVRQERGCL